MYVTQYALVFAAGTLLSIGAYSGRARGLASIVGFFVWIVIGDASSAIEVLSNGEEFLYGSGAVTWLCYLNAVAHLVTIFVAIHDYTQEEAQETQLDLDELERQLS